MLHKDIAKFINDLDELSYFNIKQKAFILNKLYKDGNYQRSFSDEKAERFALNFIQKPNLPKNNTYRYEPVGQYEDTNGVIREFPSRREVDDKMCEYWNQRFYETKSLTLKLRYADLRVDFINPKTNGSYWNKAIDDYVNFAYKAIRKFTDQNEIIKVLERSVYLAEKTKKINDKERLMREIVRLSNNDMYIYFAFNFIITRKKLSDQATKRRKNIIVKRYKEYIDNCLMDEDFLPYNFSDKILKLVKYYADADMSSHCEEILNKLEIKFRNDNYLNSSSMLRQNYLNEILSMYTSISKFFFAKLKRKQILSEIVNVSKSIISEMQKNDIQIEISQDNRDKFKQLYDDIFNYNLSSDNLIEMMQKIFLYSLPSSSTRISSQPGLMSFISSFAVNNDGLQIYEESSNAPISYDYMNTLSISSDFLRVYIDKLISIHKVDEVVERIFDGSFFRDDDKKQVIIAIKSYQNNLPVITSSLLIPIIEFTIREMHQCFGLDVIQENRYGGFDYYSDLGQYINDPLIIRLYKETGRAEDIQTYLNAVLTSKYGWNIRNNFAHGINKSNLFSKNIAATLINVLFILSLVRLIPSDDPRAEGAPTLFK